MAITSGREQFTTFAIIGIMVLSAIFFIATTQRDNDVNEDDLLLANPIINSTFSKLQTNLTDYRTVTQGQRENFESEIPERGFGSLIIFSIVTVWQKFFALIIGVYNIIIVIPASILGVSNIVIGVLDSIVIVALLLLGWRIYRVGS